jgi:hypothetical protein
MTRLIAHVIDGHPFKIRPAPLERAWMDATDRRFAYRCLPLNIANAHGWEILNPAGFVAVWDGGPGKDAVQVRPDPGHHAPAMGHFGSGVLTFHVPAIFETDPGVDLIATGPVNRPKDAVSPLTGVIETDWAPYTFTMNWMITRPNTPVRFEKDEPFCHLFPVARGALEAVEPQLAVLSASPDLQKRHLEWAQSRTQFNADLEARKEPGPDDWQKTYFRGQQPSGEPGAPAGHRSKLRLKPFAE